MSQELIYTSVPRGLKPGSQGFCTVVSTKGMATSLVQRLEALSGYRHVYSPQDPNARLNPVIYSHLLLDVAGRRCHVLSRICDAGLDYTQRNNKFAHHVVLDKAELVPAGPAGLLSLAGFMQAAWNGEPTVLPAGRRPPAGDVPVLPCRAWQRVTGDAGWGGVLAETAANGAARPAVLIFRPGTAPLPLLSEALALLPPQVRWGVSFSTYLNKLPPGVDCQWRCVLEGSPEAAAARRLSGAVIIDLCGPRQAAAGGRYVEAARTGIAPVVAGPAARATILPRSSRPSDGELARLLAESPAVSDASMVAPPVQAANASLAEYGLAPPPRSENPLDLAAPPLPRRFKLKPKSKTPLIAGLGAVAIILAAGIAGLWIASNKTVKTPVAQVNKGQQASSETPESTAKGNENTVSGDHPNGRPSTPTAAKQPDTQAAAVKSEHQPPKTDQGGPNILPRKTPDEGETQQSKKLPQQSTVKPTPNTPPVSTQVEPTDKAAETHPMPKPLIAQEPKSLDKWPTSVDLPALAKGTTLGEVADSELIAKTDSQIKVAPTIVDISLTKEFSFRQQENKRTWCWYLTVMDGADKTEKQIAEIQWRQNQGLFFQWSLRALPPHDLDQLRNHFVQIAIGNEKKLIALRKAKKEKDPKKLPIGLQASDTIRIACDQLEGFPHKATYEFELISEPSTLPKLTLAKCDRPNSWTLIFGGAEPLHFVVRLLEQPKSLLLEFSYKGVLLSDPVWDGTSVPIRPPREGLRQFRLDDIEQCQENIVIDREKSMKQHESKEKERPKDKNDMAYLKAIRILDAQIKNDDVLLKKLKVLRDLFKLTENLRLHYRIYAKTDAKNDLKVPLYTTEDEP